MAIDGSNREDLAYFKTSWAKDIINECMSKNGYILKSNETRTVKSDGEDSLFGGTLRSPSTISRALALCKPAPAATVQASANAAALAASGAGAVTDPGEQDFGETLFFLSLGNGLNGHPDILHGGITAVIADETLGNASSFVEGHSTFTAWLRVDYKSPLPTPSDIMVRAKMYKEIGRKRWLRASIEGPQGKVYATAEGLFIKTAGSKAKL
ncbi:HotDog domain-containing protein [Protomyces lactucae-debilis]|uniref:HotDog domain-containing protein n=1 Tax=Protomyces lactucae-debilis TaxID=2754530 RepID=A0A1Y2FUH4_PROLT|nr:HotDog domain-containing protein [Protomyces lactucae-debilis]ORY87652.1 HotDog domain-containing protein [Protomyces lactucae-debilis]